MNIFILSVIANEGINKFEEVVVNNDMVGVLLLIISLLVSIIIYQYKKNDNLTNNYQSELKKINDTISRKEDERVKQSQKSEKELLEVLNGVSTIIKMSEQADKYEHDKMLNEIRNIGEKILDKIDSLKNN